MMMQTKTAIMTAPLVCEGRALDTRARRPLAAIVRRCRFAARRASVRVSSPGPSLRRRVGALGEAVHSLGHDMSIMGTGIYGATPQWARIGAIMVVCSWHDALAADQLPRQIVGNWCLTSVRMLPERYAYRRCKDSNYDIIVRWDGFDAQETSCNLNKIDRQGAAWLANFGCSGAGLKWLEDDEIRVSKDGWTLETKIKKVRRVGDPVRYCLLSKC
jgi:hypothetical protein